MKLATSQLPLGLINLPPIFTSNLLVAIGRKLIMTSMCVMVNEDGREDDLDYFLPWVLTIYFCPFYFPYLFVSLE